MVSLFENFWPLLSTSAPSPSDAIGFAFRRVTAGLRLEYTTIVEQQPDLKDPATVKQSLANDIVPLSLDAHWEFDRYQWYMSPLGQCQGYWLAERAQPPSIQAYYAHGGPPEGWPHRGSLRDWASRHADRVCPALLAAAARCAFEMCGTTALHVSFEALADMLLSPTTPSASGAVTPSAFASTSSHSSSRSGRGPGAKAPPPPPPGSRDEEHPSSSSGEDADDGNEAGSGVSRRARQAAEQSGSSQSTNVGESSSAGWMHTTSLTAASTPQTSSKAKASGDSLRQPVEAQKMSPPRTQGQRVAAILESLLSSSQRKWLDEANTHAEAELREATLTLWTVSRMADGSLDSPLWTCDCTSIYEVMSQSLVVWPAGLPRWLEVALDALALVDLLFVDQVGVLERAGGASAMEAQVAPYRDFVWSSVLPHLLCPTA